jgi:hypothetical protein
MYDEPETPDPHQPPLPKLSVARPLIGIAMSICIGVVGLLVGFERSCGGFNGNGPDPSVAAAFSIFFASMACGLGCLIWFVIVMAKNYYRS